MTVIGEGGTTQPSMRGASPSVEIRSSRSTPSCAKRRVYAVVEAPRAPASSSVRSTSSISSMSRSVSEAARAAAVWSRATMPAGTGSRDSQ